MTPERAAEIVSAINDRALYQLGMVQKLGSLAGVSLAEMVEAKNVIEAGNLEARQRQEREGGSITIRTIPDDRLIAAAYALEHYRPTFEAIAVVPTSEWPFDRRVIGVFGLEPGQGGGETDDEG